MNGKQVIMPYKKEVFNPRTKAQMSQRAKFALSGMINRIVPKEVLVGMSPDRRKRRPLFASNIARHANVSTAGGSVTATLDANDLVFSQGVAAPVTVNRMTATDGLVSGTLEALPEKVDAVMMIAVVYDTTVGLYTRTVYEVLPAGETAISLDTQTTETSNVAHIYAVPMSLTSTGLSLTSGSDGAENSSDNGYAYTLMMRSDEGSFQYGRSQYLTTLALG
ncbi:MAG: hypothetical protein IKN32_08115 [Bacteroidales bacterium]|nr:hypothetical protein [Bacteroidales bacterium]